MVLFNEAAFLFGFAENSLIDTTDTSGHAKYGGALGESTPPNKTSCGGSFFASFFIFSAIVNNNASNIDHIRGGLISPTGEGCSLWSSGRTYE